MVSFFSVQQCEHLYAFLANDNLCEEEALRPIHSESLAGNFIRKNQVAYGHLAGLSLVDGDKPVQEYISAIPGWKKEVARSLDKLIAQHIPKANKAVKWNSPFYGMEDKGWV